METRTVAALARRSLVLLLLVLAFGITLAGCGSGEEEAGNAPAEPPPAAVEETVEATAPEETGAAAAASARTATVRLSGTEGTIYAGSYGNLDGSEYAEGLLEEPVEFSVDLRESGFDVVNASFSKPDAEDDGTLKIEIISGGEVVAEQEAETQYGTLNLTWSSEG